ncbi:Smg-4/UPF3 family-domain-containing protein [Mucor mucedo]|uniref:Smg-4/UPF3 family-domain-containing protein n=1 Tax=Mucor mucedo TaxID=29922 RepID=UPI00221ECCB5|nr:Smg-4/UPF3 family-domain-containing protein [Mucor mucedo]KAI7866105.1 Smg-4/UPF3 family-domain-containing protein [Mucor mucedo]
MSAVVTPSSTPLDSPKVVTKVVDGKTSTEKPKKRTKKRSKRHARKPTLKTKVIVRRLPPNLPEEIFFNSVKPWINQDNVDYSLYVPGKLSKSKAKESVFSRAYFHFKTMEAVIAFHQGFDGHGFMDSRGNENRAVVEFAPYQKIPREHKTVDVRQGTIDEDQDYLDFLESLKAEEKSKHDLENETGDGLTQIERLENRIAMVTAKTLAAEQANKPKTTPLLEHLRAQKAAQAAARVKSSGKKTRKQRSEKSGSTKKTEGKNAQSPSVSGGVAGTAAASGGGGGEVVKKKRERNRKKKDGDKKEGEGTNSPKPPRPPREPREAKEPKEPRERPPRDPKTKAPKPKRPARKNDENKPPVKILGRQTPAAGPSTSG